MDNWTISDLLVTAAGLILTWIGGAVALFYSNRRAAQKRQEAKDLADAAERQQEIDRNRKDDEIRTTLINEVIRRNDELANQIERLNDERLSEILNLQKDLKSEKDRNQIREEGLQRQLNETVEELKNQLNIAAVERTEYRRRIDEHSQETTRVIENQGRTLAIAEQLGKENEELRRRVGELETKVSGYATLQEQLTDVLKENADLKARVKHLEEQLVEKDQEIALLKVGMEAIKNKPVAAGEVSSDPTVTEEITLPEIATTIVKPEGNDPL